MVVHFLCVLLIVLGGARAEASNSFSGYRASAQILAFAPNAGGQEVYSLRLLQDDTWEYSLFANQYLDVEGLPLMGVGLHRRWNLYSSLYPLRLYTQLGLGVANVGPFVEVLWGSTWLWLVRLDVASHLYVTAGRFVSWSLPLWVGVSLPFS